MPRVVQDRVRFTSFPRTTPPPPFIHEVVKVFLEHSHEISSVSLQKGLTSDGVLARLRPDLVELGFQIEASKNAADKIERPVFFGENGAPTLRYEIDGFHPIWRCGLEVEAGRAWMGNAVYRDLVQAMVMVDVDWLVLAVSNTYKYQGAKGKQIISHDYDNTISVAEAIFGHSRVRMPYSLVVLGY